MTQRLEMYQKVPEIAQRPGLAEAIVRFEEKTGRKLPSNFRLRLRAFGEESGISGMIMYLGKLHQYYVTGFQLERDETAGDFSLFESQNDLKFYFMNLPGIDGNVLKFWVKQIAEWEGM